MNRCKCCQKEYTQQSAYEKHELVCSFVNENAELPSYATLVKIVRELSLKNQRLERKVDEMQKTWRRHKISIHEWLNEPEQEHLIPNYSFSELIKRIEINSEKHMTHLLERNTKVHQTILLILDDNYTSPKNTPLPIYKHKSNFYRYDANEENQTSGAWTLLERKDYERFLNQVHVKLVTELFEWRKKNEQQIDQNDKLSTAYNKAMIKLMNYRV